MNIFRFASRFLIAFALAVPAAHAQTPQQYTTVPSIAALKAMTNRPQVVQVTGTNAGTFNLNQGACDAADDMMQIQPTSGSTVCYVRAIPSWAASGATVDARIQGANCNGVADSAGALTATASDVIAKRAVAMLPPGNCLTNSGVVATGPLVMRGTGSGAGPGALDPTTGSLVLPNFAAGDVLSFTSSYAMSFSDFQINSNVGQRSSGAGLLVNSAGSGTTNGLSQIGNVAFNNQYDDIRFSNPTLPLVTGTYHQNWKNAGVKCDTSPTAEPTCGNYLNNYFFGDASSGTTQVASLHMKGGYFKSIANHLLGAQAGILIDADQYPVGAPNAFFNTIENSVHYGIRAKNTAGQAMGQVSWVGNEFLTENTTTGPTLKAFMQVDANSTPGSTWARNVQILGNNMRGQLTTTSGPGPAGVPAYVSIDGTAQWQLADTQISAMNGDTAVGVVVGADARGGLIHNLQMSSESGATVTKYAGTLTYTQIYDMQGVPQSQLASTASANGSLVYVTDGQINASQAVASGGSGVWAQRIGGNWVPVMTPTALFAGTNSWTGANTFKSPNAGSNVTIWNASNNNTLARIYDDSASGLVSIYNAAASERIRLYAAGESFIEDDFRVGGVVRANTGFSANGTAGVSKTVTVRDAAGTGTCTLIFTTGIYTGGTC